MTPLILTSENFQSEVLQSTIPVLIDFWAPWCAHCRVFSPVIDEIAAKASGFKVGKVNVDEQSELAASLRIMSIPTLILFKNGSPAARTFGVQSKEKVLDLLK